MIDELIGQFLGRAAQHVSQHAGVEDPETKQALTVIGLVQQHFFGRWLPAQRTRVACAIRVNHPQHGPLRCAEPMIGACVACNNPICIEHASVTITTGDAICYACIELVRAQRAQQVGPIPAGHGPYASGRAPAPEAKDDDFKKLRRKHMRTLGLKGDPTEEEIRAAFRTKAAASHPDKARTPAAREKATKRFKKCGEARDWLIANVASSRAA
ncbi:MAG: J domain-containing protein [Planctomycetota bacterium]